MMFTFAAGKYCRRRLLPPKKIVDRLPRHLLLAGVSRSLCRFVRQNRGR